MIYTDVYVSIECRCVCASSPFPYLPQLLVEVRRVDLSFLVTFLMIKVQIPANEKGSQELLHLHSDVQRDGDDEVIEDQKRQEV